MIVICAFFTPFIQANDAVLPQPGALGLGFGIKMTLQGINEVLGPNRSTLALRKSRIVDKMSARLDTDGVNETVCRYLRQILGQVGCQLVRPRQIFVAVQRVVQVDHQHVGVNVRRLGRIETAGGAIHGMAVCQNLLLSRCLFW